MQYIDADLLREKITEQIKSLPREVGRGAGVLTSKGYGMMEAFQIMRSIINSLQQEKSEELHFTPLNRLIQKIPSKNWNDTVNNYARKLRDCLIREGYRKDAELLQGYISYMNGNNVPMATMDKQEQPDADFEEEFAKFNIGMYNPFNSGAEIHEFARHFYELGLNARKEE